MIGCSADRTQNGLKGTITEKEDALKNLAPEDDDLATRESMRLELIDALLDYYRTFPEDKYSPECLDKVHFVYTAMRKFASAARYGDTLLINYPNYVNREMVIESQYNTYDMFIEPRNVEKVEYYLNMWLSEYPNMDKDKKEEIEYRLKYVDLTIEQIMDMRMTDLK
jgi:hypothetical protein